MHGQAGESGEGRHEDDANIHTLPLVGLPTLASFNFVYCSLTVRCFERSLVIEQRRVFLFILRMLSDSKPRSN